MLKPPKTKQQSYWSQVYTDTPALFGEEASEFAHQVAALFQAEGVETILELGFGQGRDTVLLAQSGFSVTALDYSQRAIEELTAEVADKGLTGRVEALFHDVRQPLPYPDDSFDACYSHMLFCMELTEAEIAFALAEVHRVLKPEGLALYSARSDHDVHYGAGTRLGEDIYEVGEFVVHFFSEAKIHRLARGYDLLNIERMEEGSLPRDLYLVSMRKNADIEPLQSDKEEAMARPMDKFQEFFDATLQNDIFDDKTRGLMYLTASLAGGCEL